MPTLKNVLFVAILAAAACGVYVTLYRNSEPPPPPEDTSEPRRGPAAADG